MSENRPETKIIRYERRSKLSERNKVFKRKTQDGLLALTERVLLCVDSIDVDASVSLARVLHYTGVNSGNYLLCLRFLETNNSHVVRALIGKRNPVLMFSPVKPNWFLVKECFRLLARFSREEIADIVLLALLGVIQNTYKISEFGYSIYALTVADVYSIGKYLDKKKGQTSVNNNFILDLLFDIYQLGIDSFDRKIINVAIAANAIRMVFFDNTKRMEEAIPSVLLISDARSKEINPKFIAYDGGDGE